MSWKDACEHYVFKVQVSFSSSRGEEMRVHDRHFNIDFTGKISPEIKDMIKPGEFKIYVKGMYNPADDMVYLSERVEEKDYYNVKGPYVSVFPYDVTIREIDANLTATSSALEWLDEKGYKDSEDFHIDMQGNMTGQTIFSFKKKDIALIFKLSQNVSD